MTDPWSIVWWVQNFGIGGALVFVHGYAIYRFFYWAKPYAEKTWEGHLNLLAQAKQSLTELPGRGDLEVINKNVIDLGTHVAELKKKSDSNNDILIEIHKKVVSDETVPS